MRWNIKAQYIPGKLLGGVDALSRYGIREYASEFVNWVSYLCKSATVDDALDCWSEAALWHMSDEQPPMSETVIMAETMKDAIVQKLKKIVYDGFPASVKEIDDDIKPFWRSRYHIEAIGDVIYVGGRVLIPKSLRKQALDTLHSAHQGTTAMRLRAASSMYWPGMMTDID